MKSEVFTGGSRATSYTTTRERYTLLLCQTYRFRAVLRHLASVPTWHLKRRRLFLHSLLVLFLLIPMTVIGAVLAYGGLPPDYSSVREHERELSDHGRKITSQHSWKFASSKEATDDRRYLRFPDHAWGLGLNNVLQEAGWITGERGYQHEPEEHRPVPAEFFESACPPSLRVEIEYLWDSSEVGSVDDTRSYPPANASGIDIREWWERRLQDEDVRDARCVVIRESERRIFDDKPLRSSICGDPVTKHHSPTPLDAHPTISPSLSTSQPSEYPQATTDDNTITGLLAVHLRRGDYKHHCVYLSEKNFDYQGINRLPGIPDTFNTPHEQAPFVTASSFSPRRRSSSQTRLEATQVKLDHYFQHCLPTIPQIVQRLHDIRDEYQSTHFHNSSSLPGSYRAYALRDVYVLTNGWPSFAQDLRAQLLADGWESVVGTPDMGSEDSPEAAHDELSLRVDRGFISRLMSKIWHHGLSREEKGVSVAIDMAIAQQAEVFVGNGSKQANEDPTPISNGYDGLPQAGCRINTYSRSDQAFRHRAEDAESPPTHSSLVPSPHVTMHTYTPQELETLFELGLGYANEQFVASPTPCSKNAALLVPGGRWLLAPMKNDHQQEQGRMCYFDLHGTAGEARRPRTICGTQPYDLSSVSFSGIQLETGAPSLTFTFAQVYRAAESSEDHTESPWLLHVWRVREISDALHAECIQTMRLGSLDDSEARVALYSGSLRDDMLAFSINMESDDFSVVMVANWKEVGDDDECYEGKIFPRIGERQQFESLTLLPDSQVLLSSTSGQLSTIYYACLNASIYPEYDGSLMTEAEVIQLPISTSTDSHIKERISARLVDITSSTTAFQSHTMAAQRAIQCQ
ncbi:hypothetical protein D9619_000051 [Psilocybe cf. subviscida]|uniref:Uncharacterized protein n=1 Tax=Psilocybe cf. subviscida TaxID=2480587 RepID=A0A8H5BET0_9AGAR|nr:hypothetical protein D9619_000051 [Psilocybe cf. subviscida]